ncbi:unnamed protein product [Closterium sp. NIES-53]
MSRASRSPPGESSMVQRDGEAAAKNSGSNCMSSRMSKPRANSPPAADVAAAVAADAATVAAAAAAAAAATAATAAAAPAAPAAAPTASAAPTGPAAAAPATPTPTSPAPLLQVEQPGNMCRDGGEAKKASK